MNPRISVAIALTLCTTGAFSMIISDYGTMPDGRVVHSYTFSNVSGLQVTLLNYGATLASVKTRDRRGVHEEITLGYDQFSGWLNDPSHFGVTVGRFANRIAHGKFTLDGKEYVLATNNSPGGIPCHIHGGIVGFDKVLWSGRVIESPKGPGVEFTYVSADGEEGYPGKLTAKVTYWLSDGDELGIEFRAVTDRTTIINLTNHTYWNLEGNPLHPISGHLLRINSDTILPVNKGLIPTGERMSVVNTPFDFTELREIGKRIGDEHEQLKQANGYDHCWVLRDISGVKHAAQLFDPKSGRVADLFTDQPSVQFYSGNFLRGASKGRGGIQYRFRTGLCLEPENFPDAPNHPDFPSARLEPGEVYRRSIVWRFSTR